MKYVLLIFLFTLCNRGFSQSTQVGPYTVTKLEEGVFNIEDANDSNPAGLHRDENGEVMGMNNCSDMYLIVGTEKAMLIEVSNWISWDETAPQSLRSLVYDRIGSRPLYISCTHRHGDHLGMLPAFKEEDQAHFWMSASEFEALDVFPKAKSTFFAKNSSLDLGGGFIVDTYELPGHTPHSILFFLKGKNRVFTGDAMGSGSGVWLFNEESFYTYKQSISDLIKYVENASPSIDPEKFEVHGGHSWQVGSLEKLTIDYIYDMDQLMNKMKEGSAVVEDVSYQFPFLNANFKYGTATITWNKEAAEKYRTDQ